MADLEKSLQTVTLTKSSVKIQATTIPPSPEVDCDTLSQAIIESGLVKDLKPDRIRWKLCARARTGKEI